LNYFPVQGIFKAKGFFRRMKALPSKCVPCEGGIPPLTKKQAGEWMTLVKGWSIQKGTKITRSFTFKDFLLALKFVNKVGALAEKEGHHPDFEIHWNKVTLTLWTHAIGGLSANDFVLARKINALR
jgi:4a-hydroxytetrahydrobiopterin dehydratase